MHWEFTIQMWECSCLYDRLGLCHVRHVRCYEVVVTVLGANLPAALHHLFKDMFPASCDDEASSQSGIVIGQLLANPGRGASHQHTLATDAL